MEFDVMKQRIVEEIRKDAARFITEQFSDGGVFEYSIYASESSVLPIIIRVTDGEQFSLSVTIWDYVVDSFSKITYTANGVQNEDGSLSWKLDSSYYDSYTDAQDADRFLPEIIIGKALGGWKEIVSSITARGDYREYAWFFPLGLKPALNHAGMTMSVSNQN